MREEVEKYDDYDWDYYRTVNSMIACLFNLNIIDKSDLNDMGSLVTYRYITHHASIRT